MSHGTPSVTSPISLQELAWQHGLTATQETPILVQRLHVADTGGVTRLAVPLHLSLGITHGDRSHSLKLSTLPHSSHASSMAACNVLGPCKGTLHPTLLGAGTPLSGYPHLPSFPPSKEAAHMGPSPRSEGSRCGVLGKGQMDLASIQETAAAFLFLPSSAYHNSIPGKDHFGSPAPP